MFLAGLLIHFSMHIAQQKNLIYMYILQYIYHFFQYCFELFFYTLFGKILWLN